MKYVFVYMYEHMCDFRKRWTDSFREKTILTDGLQRRCFGTWILRNAIAHAGHPVTGRAVTVTLPTGVSLRISAEESLERRSDLGLATDRRENQHPLESVY